MSMDKSKLKDKANYTISGAGVLHVRSSEILKTRRVQKQIEAATDIMEYQRQLYEDR